MGLVGIVLVSHSEQLASGLRDLLRQVASPEVRVEPAGGTAEGELGTSPDRLTAAIAAADSGAGVVILADLGSAVLTARAVLEDGPWGSIEDGIRGGLDDGIRDGLDAGQRGLDDGIQGRLDDGVEGGLQESPVGSAAVPVVSAGVPAGGGRAFAAGPGPGRPGPGPLLGLGPGPLLVDAPFVEGAVAAAVTASTGADLAAVAEAAREARDVPKF